MLRHQVVLGLLSRWLQRLSTHDEPRDAGSDNPRGEFGVVYHNTDADVSVIDNIPNTKARWGNKNYPRPGVTGPAESGPAMKRLQRGESN